MVSTVRRTLADRVWQWRKATYALSLILVSLALLLVFFSISAPEAVEPSSEPTFFDAGRALRTTRDLYGLYPDRSLGSPDAAGAANWYSDRLRTLNVPQHTQRFSEMVGGVERRLTVISTVLPGSGNDVILVSAPRDPGPFGFAASMDEAAGTGILLDLIQVFAARPHAKTMVFVSTEGASLGGLGLARFLEVDPHTPLIRAAIALGPLGRAGQDELQAEVTGLTGATPGWLVRLAGDSLRESEYGLRLPGLYQQVADHALGLAQGEQVAVLRAGIPGLLLRGQASDEGGVSIGGLATQGVAIERVLLSLDAGSGLPPDPGTALLVGSGRYVSQGSLTSLALVMLVPSLAMAGAWLAGTRMRPDSWMRFLRNLVSFMLPVASVLGLAWVASLAGLIPRYPHQAPLNDPLAIQPQLVPSLVLAATGVVVFFLSRHWLGYLRSREPAMMAEMGKSSIGLLTLGAGLALLASHSPFSLLAGMTAAWFWPLVTCFSEPRPPAVRWVPSLRSNAVVLLAGLAAPLLLYGYLAQKTGAGLVRGWWFLIVQTVSGAYGLRGPAAFVMMTGGSLVLLGVRRLRLQPIETLAGVGHAPFLSSGLGDRKGR